MKEIRVILFVLLSLQWNQQCALGCPTACTCQGTQVVCSGKGLTAIPSDIEITTTHLDLSNNDITAIGTSLSDLQALASLDLHNNSISSVDVQSLASLTELTFLNLASNQISMLSPLAFNALTKLEDLNLARNQLEILPNGLFNKSYLLKTLDLKDNRLTDVSLPIIDTVYLALLRELDLSRNILLHLPYLAFHNLASLERLSIIRCSTNTIDSNAFVGLNKLQIIDLSLNKMTSFRREIFQSIPHVSQLGIYGNPIACSCSIKQVQDFLRENAVTVLVATGCTLPDGGTLDIEHGDLNFLCPDPTTTPPSGTVAPWCGGNTTLGLKLLDADKDSALLKCDIHNGVLPPEADLHLYVRKAMEDAEEEYNLKITQPETPISLMLDEATPYVACIYQMDCRLRECLNFATDGYGESGVLSLAEAVGTTSACFLVIIIVLVIVLVICRWKTHSNYDTATVQTTNQLGPEKVQIYPSEDPYEDIPPDSPLEKKPKRRHANDALPQPGADLGLLATIDAPTKRPVTAHSQTAEAKQHSPHKFDKNEHIATGAHTKVFRRPNTTGSQSILTDGPGLPPKSGILSKSQEFQLGNQDLQTMQGFSKSESTVVPVQFSPQNSTEKSRSSHVYIEPDAPYEND